MGREVEGEVSGWRGTGAHVHPWLIHVDAWQKPPQYCKVIILQLKKKKKGTVGGWGEVAILPKCGKIFINRDPNHMKAGDFCAYPAASQNLEWGLTYILGAPNIPAK